MSLLRGLTGVFLGAIERAGRFFYRLVTEGITLGRPAPTPEIAEEVRVIKETIAVFPEPEQLEAMGYLTKMEQHTAVREIFGIRPFGTVFDPERLPEGPFAWREGRAGAVFKFTYEHPITGDVLEQHITVRFDRPRLIDELLQEALEKFIDSILAGLSPRWFEWEIAGASRRRVS
jgi:hypothetical protein